MTDFTAYDELMPKIQALIAPGESSSSKDKSSNEHHFFKRKGKWHNHDYCDACGEKGKLLCCDICPASFHLLCHDPPLDVAHVPNGPWTCYACNNIRDRKNNPSKKSYKIEFINGSSASTGSTRGRRILNSTRNAQKKDLLPAKSLLFLSLSKPNSSSVANTSKSIISKSTNYDSISSTCEKGSDFRENFLKLNPKHRPVQPEVRPNNGNASPITNVDHQDADSNHSDVEIKDEWIGESEYVSEDLNSNSRNSQRKNILSVDETVEKSNLDGVDAFADPNRSNFNISILNCDFVLGKKSVPGDRTEARISSLEKCCLVKEKNTSAVDDKSNSCDIEKIFNFIVSETKTLNPRQFVLPREYVADLEENVLNPEKDLDSFSCDWDSNDLLKIPTRRCYFCNGICLSGQLISCDYCPAHFHLNCLDPPMCSVPDVKWMCPLHPHHILEKIMDNPDSITQLTAWWREFSESIDSKEVISKFIKRIHQQRKNAPPPAQGSVKIPDIVKYHYKNPVRHIPEQTNSTNRKSDCVFEEDFTLIPHELIMISNDCCSRQRIQNDKSKSQIIPTSTSEKSVFVNAAFRDESRCETSTLIEITSDEKQGSSNSNLNGNVIKKSENLSTWDPENKSFRFKSFGIYDAQVPTGQVKTVKPEYDKPPWEKIEEILDASVDNDLIIGGSKYTMLDRELKRFLINEELQSIVQDLPPSFLPDSAPYPFTPPFMNNTLIPDKKSSSQVHAVLCPLSHRAPVIFMHDGTLSIGTDFSNDVCLLNYGHCNFVSGEHAVIFYDKPSKTYELLNYSEYCTVVDGITYTCDISSPRKSDKICWKTSAVDKVDSVVVKKSCAKQSNDLPADKVIEPAEKLKPDPTTVVPSISRTKPSGTESRNLFKKLMTDIDKLILKSKKEMASIAEEDLNEIARAVKASADANRASKEWGADKQKVKKKPDISIHLKRFDSEIIDLCDEDSQPKIISKENPAPANSKPSPENVSQHINNSCEQPPIQNTTIPDTIAAPSVLPVIKEVKSIAGLNQAESTALRRSERKIKRSIFSTYRRELRKDKKLELDMLGSDSDDELNAIIKKISPPVTAKEESSNSNRPPNNGRYIPETKEKCRCQLNNSDLPDGMDASWESAAALRHGSHIRFGCVEFVFSIVNYTSDLKVRPYQQLRTSSAQTTSSRTRKPKGKAGRPPEEAPPPKKAKKADDEDLSSKLRSLLNVLSATKSSPSRSSNSSAANLSPRSSPELSRTPSPLLPSNPSDPSCLIEINYETTDQVRHEIKTEDS